MTTDIRTGYKILSHDYRPPVQRGDPVLDAQTVTYPHTLPTVTLDASVDECGAGWNYSPTLAQAFKTAGLWPDGWPSRGFAVTASVDAVERGDKRRSSTLTLDRPVTDGEITEAIAALSVPFDQHAEAMAAEQGAWYRALGRPDHNAAAAEAGLRQAITARGLTWSLERFGSPSAAWDVGASWAARAARAARDAWAARAAGAARASWAAGAARAAWAARDAGDAWAAWAAWDARAARAARAAWAARDAGASWAARAARAAGAALTVSYAARRGWVSQSPDHLTVGLRDAYSNGLAIALPAGPDTLGWAMVDAPDAQ